MTLFNISGRLSRVAEQAPMRIAVVMSQSGAGHGRTLTFADLESLSNRVANGLFATGFRRGDRTLVMVKPGVEFLAIMFALFKIGAVPILIDPGMGLGRLAECIQGVEPQAFVGIPIAHAFRILRRRHFHDLHHTVTVGRRWGWSGPTIADFERDESDSFDPAPTRSDDPAAILFTSGSTGPAKGVVYDHGMFDAQISLIQSCYGLEPGEVDLTGFAPFALFSAAMGLTSVIPDIDFSRPARVDPATIVRAIDRFRVTNTFGSPAIWRRVAGYCIDHSVRLPTLRRVLIAGAPVESRLIENVRNVLCPGADIHTPYGATEVLPVCSISGMERVTLEREASKPSNHQTQKPISQEGESFPFPKGSLGGICVGKPLPGMQVRIIQTQDGAIKSWSDDLQVPAGIIGEIAVSGPVTTRTYFNLSDADALAKIPHFSDVWHRMGDVGYQDDQKRVWFCGRKAHRVVTERDVLYSICCEQVFNQHPRVSRSALVGIGLSGHKTPVIIIEPVPGQFPNRRRESTFRRELFVLGQADTRTARIDKILFKKSFPVDVRHNTKINREQLADWAARRLG